MLSRYFVLAQLLLFLGLHLVGCDRERTVPIKEMTIGIVSFDAGDRSLVKYEPLKQHLAQKTNNLVELEPAFNELRAVEQIQKRAWSIVFAPPGVAAIAIDRAQYIPIFRLEGVNNVRSVIVVRADSPIQSISDLANKTIALGQPGSATGYYLPLYDLYGLTLAEIRFAPTPKAMLGLLGQGTVAAGALSEDEFRRYRNEFEPTKFRILHTSRPMPPGVVLLGSTVDRNQEALIRNAMSEVPANIAGDAGYIPNAETPNYKELIELVEKVKPLEAKLRQKPAVLKAD